MKFCLNTSTIKPQSLIRKIELAGQAGYDGIELWVNDIYEHIGRGGEVNLAIMRAAKEFFLSLKYSYLSTYPYLTLVRAKNPVFDGLAKAHAVRAGVRAAQGFEYHT